MIMNPSTFPKSTLPATSAFVNLTESVAGALPIPIAPTSPDFAQCNRQYGNFPSVPDVLSAVDLMPDGNVPQMYHIDNLDAPKHFPLTITHGDVVITADVTGPFDRASIPAQYLTPDDIRGMAGYISTACVYTYLSGQASYGGFVTRGISDLKAHILDTNAQVNQYPYPVSTAFIVLSITQRLVGDPQPGATDPVIPTLMQTWENAAITPGMSPTLRAEYMRRSRIFLRAAGPMGIRSSRKWWDNFDGAPANALPANQNTNISLNQANEGTRDADDSVDVA